MKPKIVICTRDNEATVITDTDIEVLLVNEDDSSYTQKIKARVDSDEVDEFFGE